MITEYIRLEPRLHKRIHTQKRNSKWNATFACIIYLSDFRFPGKATACIVKSCDMNTLRVRTEVRRKTQIFAISLISRQAKQ